MIKRVSIIAVLLFMAVASAMAQSPRVVLKSVSEGDKAKAVERLEKLNAKTRAEMPEMTILAEAAVLCMEGQALSDMMRGYEMLAKHIETIRESENLDKVFKGDDVTLEQVIEIIENNNCIASFKKLNTCVATDVTCTASY
jgi:hypothetical protein